MVDWLQRAVLLLFFFFLAVAHPPKTNQNKVKSPSTPTYFSEGKDLKPSGMKTVLFQLENKWRVDFFFFFFFNGRGGHRDWRRQTV